MEALVVSAIRWTEADAAEYRARAQIPLGRGVEGLDKPKRINTCALEWQEAERLIGWLDGEGARLYPELAFTQVDGKLIAAVYAVPNGGFRHKVVAAKMKAQGVRAGVLDYSLDIARGGFHGYRFDIKRRVGGVVSAEQKLWIAWLTAQGYLAEIHRGWEEARDRLIDYLSLEKPNGNAN